LKISNTVKEDTVEELYSQWHFVFYGAGMLFLIKLILPLIKAIFRSAHQDLGKPPEPTEACKKLLAVVDRFKAREWHLNQDHISCMADSTRIQFYRNGDVILGTELMNLSLTDRSHVSSRYKRIRENIIILRDVDRDVYVNHTLNCLLKTTDRDRTQPD
jgi:hypothetical protein